MHEIKKYENLKTKFFNQVKKKKEKDVEANYGREDKIGAVEKI